jgi:EmrB/QacA subfamily drug resistance transporter
VAQTATAEPVRLGTPRGRWVLLATVLGSSVVMLDATVVNVALDRLGRDLDADFGGLQWVVNAYTLTLAALILLGGSLGDRFGRRRLFVLGTVLFAAASLLCGLAPSVPALVAARALQGVAGALLTPGSLAIIAAAFDPQDRSRAVGLWSGLGGVAAAVGPFLGGWLVEWTWRAVFLVNLPLAAAVVLVAVRHVPESRDPQAAQRLDLPGTLLGALGLGGLTYALIAAGGAGLTTPVVVAGVLGVAALAAFVMVERRAAMPLVPPELFANRTFTAINLVTFLVYAALGAYFLLLILHLQVVAGYSPLAAGTAVLPVTLLLLALSSRAGALADRIGARWPLTAGPLLAAAGLLLNKGIGPDASYPLDVLPGVVLFGLGLALTVAPLTATVLASAASRHAGIASGVNNAVARAAGLLAVAVIPVAAGIGGADYTDPARFAGGFRTAMPVCAALLVAGGLLAALLIRREPMPASGSEINLSGCVHCGVTGPQLHPPPAGGGVSPGAGRGSSAA